MIFIQIESNGGYNLIHLQKFKILINTNSKI